MKDLMTLKSSVGFVEPACQKRYVYTFPAWVKALRLRSRMADRFGRWALLGTEGGREKRCIDGSATARPKQCIPTSPNINTKGGARQRRTVYLPAAVLGPASTFRRLPQPGSAEPVAAFAELCFAGCGRRAVCCLVGGLCLCAPFSRSLAPPLSLSLPVSRTLARSRSLSRSLSLSRLCGL